MALGWRAGPSRSPHEVVKRGARWEDQGLWVPLTQHPPPRAAQSAGVGSWAPGRGPGLVPKLPLAVSSEAAGGEAADARVEGVEPGAGGLGSTQDALIYLPRPPPTHTPWASAALATEGDLGGLPDCAWLRGWYLHWPRWVTWNPPHPLALRPEGREGLHMAEWMWRGEGGERPPGGGVAQDRPAQHPLVPSPQRGPFS